jgi:EF hand
MALSRRTMVASLVGLLALSGSPVTAGSGLPKGLDTDADGSVDLAEAKKAAETLFDKLDRDHDGTLDAKELRRRLSKGDLTQADLDKDGTLSKDEYLAVVAKRFEAADVDHDGTLTAKELRSKPGRALLRLLE